MSSHLVGVISDTHGLLRPEACAALSGVERILHAGDIGSPGILEALARIAPVAAIRGNVDTGDWACGLPGTLDLEVGGLRVHMLHDLAALDQNRSRWNRHLEKDFGQINNLERNPRSDCFSLNVFALADGHGSRSGADLVIAGHSHKPVSEARPGFWLLNPGSAGPRRFRLPVTLARLRITDGRMAPPEIVRLV
jgi:uncharacterized protein